MINTIDTPYGIFKVADNRSPSGDHVATVWADNDDESFTINNKTYEGRLTLHRKTSFRGDTYTYVQGSWRAELTDSAREKLKQALAPVFEALPPLTHGEKLAKVIDSARRSAHSKLEYEVLGAATSAIRDAGLSPYNSADGDDRLTPAEIAQVEAAVLDEVRAWLAEKEAS